MTLLMGSPTPTYRYGDFVIDRDDDDPDLAVVVNLPDATAQEWNTKDGTSTVAEDNPEYPPDDPIVVVVFFDALRAYDPDWNSFDGENRSLKRLARNNVPFYGFQVSKLKPASSEQIKGALELTRATADLVDYLEKHEIEVEFLDEQTILVSKFGVDYVLQPGRVVAGDGVLKSKFEEITDRFPSVKSETERVVSPTDR